MGRDRHFAGTGDDAIRARGRARDVVRGCEDVRR